jgi:hypothetical protein
MGLASKLCLLRLLNMKLQQTLLDHVALSSSAAKYRLHERSLSLHIRLTADTRFEV